MGLFKSFRRDAQRHFESKGLSKADARLAALALHPFVLTSPKPRSAGFDKQVRSESFDFARRTRDASANEVIYFATRTLQNWYLAAI